jgi:hypothetical protein
MGEDSLHLVDAVSVGARAGLLPFSREQITANYNEDAWGAYQRGDLDLALYYANNSLRLQKSQPEIHSLREKIGGQKVNGYERGILHRMIQRRFSAAADVDGNDVEFEEVEVEVIPDADSSSDASSPVAETEKHASQDTTDETTPQASEKVASMNEGVVDSVTAVDGDGTMESTLDGDANSGNDEFAPELARFLNGVISNQAMETDSAPADPFALNFSEYFDANFEVVIEKGEVDLEDAETEVVSVEVVEVKADSKSNKNAEADEESAEVVAGAASDKTGSKEEPIEVAEVEVDDIP